MFTYLKTIENLDYLSPRDNLPNLIGTIKNLKNLRYKYADYRRGVISFILYSDDTDINLKCELNKGLTESYNNFPYHNGDTVNIHGVYLGEEKVCVYGIRPAPLGLTGNMLRDVLTLSQEINSLISVQGQNGYISENAWSKLQESLFEFRDIVKEINCFGGETFEDRISRK